MGITVISDIDGGIPAPFLAMTVAPTKTQLNAMRAVTPAQQLQRSYWKRHTHLQRKTSTGLRFKLRASFIPQTSYQGGHRRMASERNVAHLAKQPACVLSAPKARDADTGPVATQAYAVAAVDATGQHMHANRRRASFGCTASYWWRRRRDCRD